MAPKQGLLAHRGAEIIGRCSAAARTMMDAFGLLRPGEHRSVVVRKRLV